MRGGVQDAGRSIRRRRLAIKSKEVLQESLKKEGEVKNGCPGEYLSLLRLYVHNNFAASRPSPNRIALHLEHFQQLLVATYEKPG